MNGPYIRAFVTLSGGHSVRSYIHVFIHFSTEMIRSTQVTHPVLLRLGGYGEQDMYMGQGATVIKM
jgi:hypothetical protein